MQSTDDVRDNPATEPSGEVYLFDLWGYLWRGRWIVIGATFAGALVAAAIVLVLPSWYRAEVVLIPAKELATINVGGTLAGLASLAGVGVGGGDATEAIAVLKSREFTGKFIDEQQLLPVLFAEKWNADTQAWQSTDPEEWPDTRDGIRYFERKVRSIVEDRRTKLVTVSIQWKDPALAAKWANLLVERLNDRMRTRALTEAEANVAYLRGELRGDAPVELQQSIGRLLESEMQKLMLARGNRDFAFRVVDGAQVPKRRSWPNRVLVVAIAAILGGALASAFVVTRAMGKAR